MGKEDNIFSEDEKEYSIRELVQKGVLDELQEKLSQISGMAFLTVNYRGEPVTKLTGFTNFCMFRRQYGCYAKTCHLINAYGGAEAAISNKPCYYKCLSGMMHIAIPIIVQQQYIGTLVGGQVKCPDAPKVQDFSDKLSDEADWKGESRLVEMFEHIPVLEYKKIQQIAEMAALCVKQLCENETILLSQRKYEREAIRLKAKEQRLKEKEEKMEDVLIRHGKDQMSCQFILNQLNFVAGLACVEDAVQTEEMTHLLMRMIQYQRKDDDVPVTLKEELELIECYLKIQKLRFDDKLSYELIKGDGIEEQLLPPKILLPFVENAVTYGVVARKGTGQIRILCYMEYGDCMIVIEDEGSDFLLNHIDEVYEQLRDSYENSRVQCEIYSVRKRLIQKYGSQYDIQLLENGQEGTKVLIRIPQSIERIRYHV